VSCRVVSCRVVSCRVVSCRVVSCGVVWCGVVWCGVVWCGVVWCGVVWCGVVWCGVVYLSRACSTMVLCWGETRIPLTILLVWCSSVWYGLCGVACLHKLLDCLDKIFIVAFIGNILEHRGSCTFGSSHFSASAFCTLKFSCLRAIPLHITN
jgi:hypothetical protein